MRTTRALPSLVLFDRGHSCLLGGRGAPPVCHPSLVPGPPVFCIWQALLHPPERMNYDPPPGAPPALPFGTDALLLIWDSWPGSFTFPSSTPSF